MNQSITRYFFVTVLIIGVLGACASQDSERNQVATLVGVFIDGMENHSWDKKWIADNGLSLYHPDVNSYGSGSTYPTITENMPSFRGVNIVTSTTIIEIDKRKETVDFVKNKPLAEDAYFVKLRHIAIATTVNKQLVIAKDPIEIYEYVILALDPKDGVFRIIDRYPDPQAVFFSLAFARKNLESIKKHFPDIVFDSTTAKQLQ